MLPGEDLGKGFSIGRVLETGIRQPGFQLVDRTVLGGCDKLPSLPSWVKSRTVVLLTAATLLVVVAVVVFTFAFTGGGGQGSGSPDRPGQHRCAHGGPGAGRPRQARTSRSAGISCPRAGRRCSPRRSPSPFLRRREEPPSRFRVSNWPNGGSQLHQRAGGSRRRHLVGLPGGPGGRRRVGRLRGADVRRLSKRRSPGTSRCGSAR